MNGTHRTAARAVFALATLLALTGCARTLPTAPVQELANGYDTAPPPPSRLSAPADRGMDTNNLTQLVAWYDVCATPVLPGVFTRVLGSRYELEFSKGSVDQLELITIKEYDRDVIDVQFGPHGLKFGEPVVLSIDFTGTKADPGAAGYDHSEPVLYWLNEETKQWEEVPGRTDWQRRRHIVRLEHFSRYVLGGKAGWRDTHPREGE